MRNVIVIGSGGHAKVIIDIINEMKIYNIIGITSNSLAFGESFLGYKVLGDDDILESQFSPENIQVAMGLGGHTDNNIRKKVFEKVKTLGYTFINVIHPFSSISKTAKIGEGVAIFPNVALNSYSELGDNVIVITGSTVDHETIVGNHVLISAGVTVGAYSNIEDEVLLALGSKIVSGITIGKKSLIAAGAVVVKNTPENSKMFGVPAKERV
jgi:sugar O-acyltransferase (sialic acid O-acetyltransferase NeuD family)